MSPTLLLPSLVPVTGAVPALPSLLWTPLVLQVRLPRILPGTHVSLPLSADFDRAIKPLPVVKTDNGVNLQAIFNHMDDQGVGMSGSCEALSPTSQGLMW